MGFDETLMGLADKAKEASVQMPEDYIKDGLMYCGLCNTPKQKRLKILGREDIVYCLCRCRADAQKVEEVMQDLKRRRKTAFQDNEHMLECTFANATDTDPALFEEARRYAANFRQNLAEGEGLTLFGEVGRGKTYLSLCIANAVLDDGFSVLVTNFPRLINNITSDLAERQRKIDALDSFDLLVLDDLAAERDTEFMNEIVFAIIDGRCKAHKPLIVTTNLSRNELLHPKSIEKQRIYSRLYEMTKLYEVKGEDRRRLRLFKKFQRGNADG